MSNKAQDIFDDRVREFLENTDGMSYIPTRARQLYDSMQYEELEKFMREVEHDLAIDEFGGIGALSYPDPAEIAEEMIDE